MTLNDGAVSLRSIPANRRAGPRFAFARFAFARFTFAKQSRNVLRVGCGGMEVDLLNWPVGQERLVQLRSENRARLLVIDPDTEAPVSADLLEDWFRRSASIQDLQARIARLERRIELSSNGRPLMDDCVLRFRGEWVQVPPIEVRIIGRLIGRFGSVVSRHQLTKAGWPGGIRRLCVRTRSHIDRAERRLLAGSVRSCRLGRPPRRLQRRRLRGRVLVPVGVWLPWGPCRGLDRRAGACRLGC